MRRIATTGRRAAGLAAALILSSTLLQSAENIAAGVRQETYFNWPNSIFLDAPNPEVKALITPAVGGRILRYELFGQNILFENPRTLGQTLAGAGGWFLMGGSTTDLGPEARDLPSHLNLVLGPYQIKSTRDHGVVVTSETDPATGVRVEREILLDPETGDLGLTHRIINTSTHEITNCVWNRTLCRSGGFVLLPLARPSRFVAGWSIRHRVEEKYLYDGLRPASPSIKVLNGVLVAETKAGPPTKFGADSDAGWIAYVQGRLLFVQYFPYEIGGHYADAGNSVTAYWDETLTELEPMSPEFRLKPGESHTFPEKWSLILLPEEVTSFKQARAAVGKIPASPFKPRR
jgi:hypothetical protein